MAFLNIPWRLGGAGLALLLLGAGGVKMELKSTAFEPGGLIPAKYTCDGQDISPPLSWSDAPTGTQSLALISDDPDAPVGTWVHWVIWNIPASARPRRESAKEGVAIERGEAGDHGLPADRLRRSLSAFGNPPVLLQALCARCDAESARKHY